MIPIFIRLSFTRFIDYAACNAFERSMLEDIQREFCIKSQAYNPGNKFTLFTEMAKADNKAKALHEKCSFAFHDHVDGLNKRIPGFTDNSLLETLHFENAELRIIEADITDITALRVAIKFTTPFMKLLKSFGEYLVIASGPETLESFTLRIEPGISIAEVR